MKKKYAIGLFVLVAIVGVVLHARSSESNLMKLGFVGPLSGFGAAWGEEQKIAIEIAVREINEKGGVAGKKIEVIYEDNKCAAQDSVTAAHKLISVDGVAAIFSVCGEGSLAIAPIAESNKVIMMALWSTHPDLSGIGQYVFRNSYSDENTGQLMAKQINSKFSKIAVINENSDFANGIRDVFKANFNGEVVEENYQPGTTDFRSYLVSALAKKPETFLFNPNSPAEGLIALQQLRQLGFTGQVFGNYFGGVKEVLDSKAGEGMIFFGDPFVEENTIKDGLYNKFFEIANRKPNFDFAVSISYDSVYIIKQAIESAGTDSDKIGDYLHHLEDFRGVMGTYGFDEKGDAVGYLPSVYVIRDNIAVSYR
jgi:branched-chain amino acid transport system substrate-binding protein